MKFQADKMMKVVTGITAGAMTGTYSGAAIDRKGYDECMVHFNVGTPTDTGAVATLTIQESPSTTSGSFAAISGASIAITASNDEKVHNLSIDLRPRKRYLRAQVVVSGTTAIDMGVSVALLAAKEVPVTQSVTSVRA